MTPDEIAALYPPTSDVETHRPVFSCPRCNARLLGPDPAEKRPAWIIPLLCCTPQEVDPWWQDKPPPIPANIPYHVLELRRHVWANRRTRERFDLWLPAL